MTSRATGARFRQRKLSTKHPLSILREDEALDSFQDDDDPSRQAHKLETGVEKAEETEHHLQAVISASAAASLGGKVAQIYIPTPEVKPSDIKYDEIYPKRFAPPTTYIRFSSTVEDCIGPSYCVTEEDEKFIAELNESSSAKDGRLTLDLFEEVVSFFEVTTLARQPFATIDDAPILSFDEFQSSYDDTISLEGQKWASSIYQHWHALRSEKANHALMPELKSETGAETDDADAYVCFRRREVRQARKTRGRDAQVVEKLKKLRRELEDARQLVHTINAREKLNLDRVECDRRLFEQRQELKRVKIQHGIKGEKGEDEELLINQRPVVKTKVRAAGDGTSSAHRPSTTLRLSTSAARPEHQRPAEQDLVQLDDLREEADALVRKAVEAKIQRHKEWNRGFVDETWNPICPPTEARTRSAHLPIASRMQLPTPPASVEGGDDVVPTKEEDEHDKMDVDRQDTPKNLPTPPSDDHVASTPAAGSSARATYRFLSPPPSTKASQPTFRRRYGRLGRLHIDAIRPRRIERADRAGVVYDSDSSCSDSDMEMTMALDSDDEAGANGPGVDDGGSRDVAVYPIDYWASPYMNFRAALMSAGARKQDPVAAPTQAQTQQQQHDAARRSSSAATPGAQIDGARGSSSAPGSAAAVGQG